MRPLPALPKSEWSSCDNNQYFRFGFGEGVRRTGGVNRITIPAHRPPRLDGGSHKQQWHVNIPTTLPPLRRDSRHPQLSHPRHGLRLHRSTPAGFRHGRDHGLQGAVLFGWVGEVLATRFDITTQRDMLSVAKQMKIVKKCDGVIS